MNLELRVATLSKLLANPSIAVQKRLDEEHRRVETILERGTDYEELKGALKILSVLAPNYHGAVIPALVTFARTLPARVLTDGGEPITARGYRSASELICEAVDVPNAIRYAQLDVMVDFLLELTRSPDERVISKAQTALQRLATIDLDYFPTLGVEPQKSIVNKLAGLSDEQLVADARAILGVINMVLSPSMEGQQWTYNAVTISRGSVPGNADVAGMRASAIALLKRMYPLNGAVRYRESVINALNAATHREQSSQDAETAEMFQRDTIDVLGFWRGLVSTEAMPLVQDIEHHSYWNYYHATSTEIANSALTIRDAIALHDEYQIYKQLIGFEGIFGDWEKLKTREEEWDYGNTNRQQAARGYVNAIDDGNRAVWRDRILEFSKTESDDLATFPVYFEFLDLLARQEPDLALELVSEHEAAMQPFLVPLLGGLQLSNREKEVGQVIDRWLVDGTHLVAIAKSLFKVGPDRLDMLEAVVARAEELDQRDALSIAMGVAATLHGQGCAEAKDVFIRGLRALAKRHDARWAKVFWFGREFKTLVAAMEKSNRDEVLASLVNLQEIDYQTEEVLRAVGETDIDAVFGFLSSRLKVEVNERRQLRAEGRSVLEDKFEAIPYQLHGLNKLLQKHPAKLLHLLRENFYDMDVRSMFPYRGGAKLVKAVFPNFDQPLQAPLLELVVPGAEDDIEFVLAITRAYGGGAPILDICKAIVKAVPEQSTAWREVAAALETTGTVWGEHGMVQAYQRKRDQIGAWKTDENERLRAFSAWLAEQLDRRIDAERQRADESLAVRKYQYGVSGEGV
ncbi:hypothetical protein FHT32_006598 [Variovorax sp. SG517]|uniref:hypothetical protein n=1 Tax=Variovorax sp. SG517 TaxID=2587117 RepID=UPI00159E9820|nr:hypothetical protein [Variovorax sp. SG517]NVM92905.1 hypothetical protein [Variovorax sp. SG517]